MKRGVALPLAIFAVLTTGIIAFFIKFGQDLPPIVATHFGAGGAANGWTDRVMFIVVACTTSFLLPPFIVAMIGIMPRVLPISMINLPHREYWLHPDRREQTLTGLLYHGLWLGCLVQALLFAIDLSIYAANRQTPARLTGPFALLAAAAFAAGLALWAWRFVRPLLRPPSC